MLNRARLLLMLAVPILSLPSDVTKQTLTSGLGVLTGTRTFPDGSNRLLAFAQHGTIYIGQLSSAASLPVETYMSFNNVDAGGEKGLMDCVFDPSFNSNSRFARNLRLCLLASVVHCQGWGCTDSH
jgi:hypothetical protein